MTKNKERKAIKAKEKEGKSSSSRMKDEAEDNRLAIETVVQGRSAKGDEVNGSIRCLCAFQESIRRTRRR